MEGGLRIFTFSREGGKTFPRHYLIGAGRNFGGDIFKRGRSVSFCEGHFLFFLGREVYYILSFNFSRGRF